jgi:hypothetical protein
MKKAGGSFRRPFVCTQVCVVIRRRAALDYMAQQVVYCGQVAAIIFTESTFNIGPAAAEPGAAFAAPVAEAELR